LRVKHVPQHDQKDSTSMEKEDDDYVKSIEKKLKLMMAINSVNNGGS
jgi:hypothetical protein